MKKTTVALIILCFSILGCKNDLVINAPYKDIAVVYGFLDQNQPLQYIRIEKIYQNSASQSTTAGAQITDSLYFDTLNVQLINIAKTPADTFNCYRVDTIPKKDGFFSSGRNTIYAAAIAASNTGDEVYQLLITNPKNNKTFTSKTNLVKNADIEYRKIAIRLSPPNHSFLFRFYPGKNAVLYDLVVRYQYKEMDISEPDSTTNFEIKNVDYYVARNALFSPNTMASEAINSRSYLDFLMTKVLRDDSKKRRSIGIIYQSYGATQDFANYLELTKPAIGVVEKNTEYSNITNGLGIFTSRNFIEIQMGMDNSTISVIESQLPNFTP